jgi:hypothetical protein
MRCAAHNVGLYKVGFTDRDPEVRASELSASTASPTKFLVVEAFAVSNGLEAERAAHRLLQPYRLADNREFFQGRYLELHAAIVKGIAPWAL